MKKIKLILLLLLLLCFIGMPYGFYNLIRWVVMVGFLILAYRYYVAKKVELAIVCGSVALLFQPFLKIVLGRCGWHFLDVLVIGFLLWLVWREL